MKSTGYLLCMFLLAVSIAGCKGPKKKAEKLASEGNYNKAAEILETYCSRNKEDYEAILLYGNCLVNLEQTDKAVTLLEAAEKGGPTFEQEAAALLLSLTEKLILERKYSEAAKILARYCRQNPDDYKAALLYGNCLVHLEQTDKALTVLEVVAKRSPTYKREVAALLFDLAERRTRKVDYTSAAQYLKRAYDLDPDFVREKYKTYRKIFGKIDWSPPLFPPEVANYPVVGSFGFEESEGYVEGTPGLSPDGWEFQEDRGRIMSDPLAEKNRCLRLSEVRMDYRVPVESERWLLDFDVLVEDPNCLVSIWVNYSNVFTMQGCSTTSGDSPRIPSWHAGTIETGKWVHVQAYMDRASAVCSLVIDGQWTVPKKPLRYADRPLDVLSLGKSACFDNIVLRAGPNPVKKQRPRWRTVLPNIVSSVELRPERNKSWLATGRGRFYQFDTASGHLVNMIEVDPEMPKGIKCFDITPKDLWVVTEQGKLIQCRRGTGQWTVHQDISNGNQVFADESRVWVRLWPPGEFRIFNMATRRWGKYEGGSRNMGGICLHEGKLWAIDSGPRLVVLSKFSENPEVQEMGSSEVRIDMEWDLRGHRIKVFRSCLGQAIVRGKCLIGWAPAYRQVTGKTFNYKQLIAKFNIRGGFDARDLARRLTAPPALMWFNMQTGKTDKIIETPGQSTNSKILEVDDRFAWLLRIDKSGEWVTHTTISLVRINLSNGRGFNYQYSWSSMPRGIRSIRSFGNGVWIFANNGVWRYDYIEPLSVTGTSHLDEAQQVQQDASVAIEFNRPIDPRSISGETVRVQSDWGKPRWTPRLSKDTKTLHLDRPEKLEKNTKYTISIAESLRDIMEEPLEKEFEFSFSTAP